jgi:hypothetical protein
MAHKLFTISGYRPNTRSKESEPRGPGFGFTPEGWSLPLGIQWNDGMVEKWNIGDQKRMMV